MDEHMPSAEAILERTKKERPLSVDASVVASFGDLYESLRAYLQNLCKVKTTTNWEPVDSAQSKPESVPVDS
jgi:hypothetical protein